jgi:hypothetical protein
VCDVIKFSFVTDHGHEGGSPKCFSSSVYSVKSPMTSDRCSVLDDGLCAAACTNGRLDTNETCSSL